MGFGTFPTLLLQGGGAVVQLVLVLLCTGGSTYLRNTRTYFMAGNFALAIVGSVIIRQRPAHERWLRYAGYCLVLSYSANFPMLMSMASGNVGGFTKKVTANAVSFTAYCVGNIIGPQLFTAKEAPSYTSGFLAMMVCFSVGLATCILLRLYLQRENRARDRLHGAAPAAAALEGDTMVNLTDKTDKEILQFRYVY
ncbi:hypothetical protein CDD83_5285 [Cordyceps sp. RAO-2017]|nr:hypothetical protein CDD83_5285 [Cordyceps sp. RAO-2017]